MQKKNNTVNLIGVMQDVKLISVLKNCMEFYYLI